MGCGVLDRGGVAMALKRHKLVPMRDRVAFMPSRLGPESTGEGSVSRPSWLQTSKVPLTIVCGPPGAGKSTYVRTHAGPRDRIICFDEIAGRLFGRGGAERPQANLTQGQTLAVLRERNTALGDLMFAKNRDRWPRAWLIVSEPIARHRLWWSTVTGARIIVLPVPRDECLARIQRDAAAGDVRGEGAIGYVDAWWRLYEPAACDSELRL